MHRYYYGIDAVRFLSALTVCIFHLGFLDWAGHGSLAEIFRGKASFEPLIPVAWFGWLGVEVFFVISGIVIAESANGASPIFFLRGRALRLLPAAWVCATLSLVMRIAFGSHWGGNIAWEYLRSLALWPRGPWIDQVYWSLAIEIVFYALIFGLLLFHAFRRVRVLAWVLGMVSSVFIAFYFLHCVQIMPDGPIWRAVVDKAELLPLKHGVYFALGIWIWLAANRSLRRFDWAGIALAVVAALAEIWARAFELRHIEAPVAAHQSAFVPMAVWLAAMAAIAAFALWPDRFTPKSVGARARLKQVGKITYPLYLVHAVVGTGLLSWMISAGIMPFLALAATITSVIAIAALVAFYGEPALRRVLAAVLHALRPLVARIPQFKGLFAKSEPITGGASS